MSLHRQPEPVRDARLLLWHCPICDLDEHGVDSRCLHCHGAGFTHDIAGFENEARPAPRPPCVRAGPCIDCAFRDGSPEDENGDIIADAGKPFWCHEGMPLVGGEYQPIAWAGNMPLGYQVCGGWWQWVTRGTRPSVPYREVVNPELDEA